MTCVTDFYLKKLTKTFRGDDKKTYQIFGVPILMQKQQQKYSFT